MFCLSDILSYFDILFLAFLSCCLDQGLSCSDSEQGFLVFGFCSLEIGFCFLEFEFRFLDSEFCFLEIGFSVEELGYYSVRFLL